MKIYRFQKKFVLVIFGASGDLAKLKLFPAIYSLAKQGRFSKDFHIVGFARSKKSQSQFKKEFEKSIKDKFKKEVNNKILKDLVNRASYFKGQYKNIEDYKKLRKYLKELTGSEVTTKLAYFSVPPSAFKDIIQNLGETKKTKKEDIRLIIEKPFGEDTESAKDLLHFVVRYFDEENIYLLDHYLGKAAVQSILNLRHSNKLLNMMMKGPEVANIQITASEKIGVTSRAGYFDQVGTIKDMLQSHLLQILGLITLSIPVSGNHESLQRERTNILSSLKFIESEKNIVIGQYSSYRKEKDVPKNSKTDTFCAVRLLIDRESWFNTPIYIRTGKKLKEKLTYVVVELEKFEFQTKDEIPNRLIFELHPDERIHIRLVNKYGATPKHELISPSHSLERQSKTAITEHGLLLLDVLRKRKKYFLCFQEIIATWRITDKIINFMKKKKIKVQKYKDNSTGPSSHINIPKQDGFDWLKLIA